jgi:DNA segregation ATPase FtsK/SpoIIIE-like protein
LKVNCEVLVYQVSFAFSISRIQRFLGIGYERAARLVDAAIELGVLAREQDHDWLVRLTEQK